MDIFEYLYSVGKTKYIIDSDKINVGKSSDGYNALLIATDFLKNNKSVFVVLSSLYEAQNYYDMLSRILPDDTLFFPASELVSVSMISSSRDFLYERIETISELLKGNKKIIITNILGAIRFEFNKDIWLNSVLNIKEKTEYNIDELLQKLVALGYEHTYMVEKTGQYSKRGSIIDIFPLNSENPVRLDFFGDEIETIKEFDFETQRSINKIDKIEILPVNEMIYTDKEYEIAKDKIYSFMESFELSPIEKDIYEKDIFKLSNHENLESLSRYIEFFDDSHNSIIDFVNDKRIYIIDPVKAKEVYNRIELDLMDYADRLGGRSILKLKMFKDFKDILDIANIKIEGLRTLSEEKIDVNAKNIDSYKGNQKLVLNDLGAFRKKTTLLSIPNIDRYNRLNDLLDEMNIVMHMVSDLSRIGKNVINACNFYLPSFELVDDGIIIINEETLFEDNDRHAKAKFRSIFKNAIKISKYDELNLNDYVVHYDFGVGRYKGIKTITLNGLKRDYLTVEYANNTGLYLPLEKIKELMKYASYDTEGVIMHEIGNPSWLRTKNKVRNKVRDISDRLIKLYANRQASNGFAFLEDSPDQIKFENEFEYELTIDQKKALDEVKHDMESPKVMDRLVCGDVGYGKTEVALRSAFKAVYSGKQVALLAPTTILARQHYNTFKGRMEEYGIKVSMLSRMVSTKDQREIINGLKSGYVDVVIGTHRLLSDEIKFKDLGLLIIDEEQRFGVTHKEKIKELKVNVDCITLTATPIPRTLQMSMVGIKDLSMIETPPKNRYPIQTYVLERNDKIISDAIIKEINRGGQVFYLYNFTETIDEEAKYLNMLVPEARITIIHGKLNKDEIEKRIQGYIDKKFDVLLCTTIIETGIDMPETNTLIIHDADRLGLAQMYQIRGRVGRSNKIAYAYLMYEPKKELTVEAEKRLSTIKEFNELGSGFKIAMRDLSIRGAGDILGMEQSGFIESVGIDMYTKILDEELNKKDNKEETKEIDFEPIASRSIDNNYISSDDLKIKFHQKISKISSFAMVDDLKAELEDRFGEIPNDLIIYMYEKLMDNFAKKLDIYKIEKNNDVLSLKFSFQASEDMDGYYLFNLFKNDHNVKLKHINKEIVIEFYFKNRLLILMDVCKYLEKIDKKINKV